jgi:hypothetical protein
MTHYLCLIYKFLLCFSGAVYADCGNFRKCILLWLYALDTQQKCLEPLHPMIQSSFLSFTELFQYMQKQLSPYGYDENNYFKSNATAASSPPTAASNNNHLMSSMLSMYTGTVLKILQQAVDEIKRGIQHIKHHDETTTTVAIAVTPTPTTFDITHFDRTLVVIVHFLIVVAESLKHCSPEETFKLKKLVYELIKLNPKNSKNLTLLHLASSKESSTIIKNHTLNSFPSVDVLQLLLECGANPNILDNECNTALHLASSNRSTSSSTSSSSSSTGSSTNERDKIIQLLLNAGTHLDSCNVHNKTASDLYKGGKLYNIINPVNYLTLQCLAAKVIQKYKIPCKDALTTKLANFVSIH